VYKKSFFLFFLFLVFCSKPPEKSPSVVELDAVVKEKFSLVLEENQKVLSEIISSEELPSIVKLLARIEATKKVTQDTKVISSLDEMDALLRNANPEDKESYFQSLSKFSEILAKINKDYRINNQYNQFFCPMVSKYWVSEGQKINNPYASDMRNCGELVK
jgi:hypothetical protein